MTNTVEKFEVGGIYHCRLLSDWDCKLFFKVLKRTAKTVTLRNVDFDSKGNLMPWDAARYRGDCTCRIGVNELIGAYEFVKPLGSYSMAPVLAAEDRTQ